MNHPKDCTSSKPIREQRRATCEIKPIYQAAKDEKSHHFDPNCPHTMSESKEPGFITVKRTTFYSTPEELNLGFACKHTTLRTGEPQTINGFGSFPIPYLCSAKVGNDISIIPNYQITANKGRTSRVRKPFNSTSYYQIKKEQKGTIPAKDIAILTIGSVVLLIMMITALKCYCKMKFINCIRGQVTKRPSNQEPKDKSYQFESMSEDSIGEPRYTRTPSPPPSPDYEVNEFPKEHRYSTLHQLRRSQTMREPTRPINLPPPRVQYNHHNEELHYAIPRNQHQNAMFRDTAL